MTCSLYFYKHFYHKIKTKMTLLSVNVNKFATIRNARGGNNPNLVTIVEDCQRFGAHGITIHPRPDERHITTKDVYDLPAVLTTEYNIEGYPDERFFELLKSVKPAQATLVPDPPGVLTSNAGWDMKTNLEFLTKCVEKIHAMGIRVSLFCDTKVENIEGAKLTGTDRVELYTEAYAVGYSTNREAAIAPYVKAAVLANNLGLGVNAGHDLSLENLAYFKQQIPTLLEVSIGHALVCDALYLGLENTIQKYLQQLK
jgi:pyridoxine 5-phosphate synthase